MDGGSNGQATRTFEGPSGNRYEELKLRRDGERQLAIKQGLIDDPEHPKSLDQATIFLGTCSDMCPQFEREQREYQNNVERWELDPLSGRIDPSRAIKAFHRPAAGNEQALPSDVRPPHVLVSTLDYLLDNILCGGDALELTHGFIRDRTRSIRQDFTLQNNRGPEAILCHERIARFHILSLHLMRAVTGFSEQQETEQLRKTLQSLAEYYNEQRQLGRCSPCEAEFRAYHILTRIRDPDVLRQVQTLPSEIRKSKHVQLALRLYGLAQRSNEELGRFKTPNCEGSQNLYARFFKLLGSHFVDYLSACLCETQFTEVRKGALKAMRKAFMPQQSGMLVNDMAHTLGFDDTEEVQEFLDHFGIATTVVDKGIQRVELHKNVPFDETDVFTLQTMSRRIVEAKRNATALNEIVRGSSGPVATAKQIVKQKVPRMPALAESSAELRRKHSQVTNAAAALQVQPSALPVTVPTFMERKSSEALTTLQRPSLPPLSTLEPVLRVISQGFFRSAVAEQLATAVQRSLQRRKSQLDQRNRLVRATARELCVGLLRDQLAIAARESIADMARRRSLLRTAMNRLKHALCFTRQQMVEARQHEEAEMRRRAAYVEALADLQKPITRSRKRSYSTLFKTEVPAAVDIHRIKTLAERFWQPLHPASQWLDLAIQHQSEPWTMFVSVNNISSPSSRWLLNKFASFSDSTKNIGIEFSVEPPSGPLRQLAALLVECTSDWPTASQRLLESLQSCATTSRVKCVLIVVSFEITTPEEATTNLDLERIMADPRTPVQSAWFVCMASMDRVDDFHDVLQRALSSASYQITADEQERMLLRGQVLRAQESTHEQRPAKEKGRAARSSFYDSHLLPLRPSKVINALATDIMSKPSTQTSALMRAIEEAKHTLSWANNLE